MSFALFFLGEYASMLLMSSVAVIFFCGGWSFFLDIDFLQPFFLVLKQCFLFLFLFGHVLLYLDIDMIS